MTCGRFTVTQQADAEGTYFELTNQWGESLWSYDTKREAVKEARRLARDEQLDAECLAEEGSNP
jgi:hypothetical protein